MPEQHVKNALVKAGLHPEGPNWPSLFWNKDSDKLDMRYTVSTARSWQSYHESMRSLLENIALSEERFDLALKHLKALRKEWKAKGPAARLFLKRRPIPVRNECIRRFYLSKKAEPSIRRLNLLVGGDAAL